MLTANIKQKYSPSGLLDELVHGIEAARRAGLILTQMPRMHVKVKEDNTLVSAADHAASGLIHHYLNPLFPDYAILDEERQDDLSRLDSQYVWVVDPLDSSKGWLNRSQGYGVIIGLLRDNNPVLGIAHRPAMSEFAIAIEGHGANLLYHGRATQLRVSKAKQITIQASITRRTPALEELIQRVAPIRESSGRGSLKILNIAKKEANLCIWTRDHRLGEWDLAGPSVILQEARGVITDLSGLPIRFNKENPYHTEGVIAASHNAYEVVRARLGL